MFYFKDILDYTSIFMLHFNSLIYQPRFQEDSKCLTECIFSCIQCSNGGEVTQKVCIMLLQSSSNICLIVALHSAYLQKTAVAKS